jgi:large subunit ribosomal protein L18
MIQSKKDSRQRVRYTIRKKVSGTSERPRLAIFRSNKEIYAQVIDDVNGNTLASASSKEAKGTKTEQASVVGKLIADNAKKAGVETVVFDR